MYSDRAAPEQLTAPLNKLPCAGTRTKLKPCQLKAGIPELDTSIDIDDPYPQRPRKLNLTDLNCNCQDHDVNPDRCEVYK